MHFKVFSQILHTRARQKVHKTKLLYTAESLFWLKLLSWVKQHDLSQILLSMSVSIPILTYTLINYISFVKIILLVNYRSVFVSAVVSAQFVQKKETGENKFKKVARFRKVESRGTIYLPMSKLLSIYLNFILLEFFPRYFYIYLTIYTHSHLYNKNLNT